jgi:rubrerythrin
MKKFTRTTEDFICEHCGAAVKGTGYTNHCPHCLWSKHVDVNPGDRLEECQGMMKPVGYQKLGDKERIVLQCQRCGFERPNKVEKEDNREALLALFTDL